MLGPWPASLTGWSRHKLWSRLPYISSWVLTSQHPVETWVVIRCFRNSSLKVYPSHAPRDPGPHGTWQVTTDPALLSDTQAEPCARWNTLIWRHFLLFLPHQEKKYCLYSTQFRLVQILLPRVIKPSGVMRRKELVWTCVQCPPRWSSAVFRCVASRGWFICAFGGQGQPTCPTINLKQYSWKILSSITSACLAHQTELRTSTWGFWALVLWLGPLFHPQNEG